jgi:hypothetical protein
MRPDGMTWTTPVDPDRRWRDPERDTQQAPPGGASQDATADDEPTPGFVMAVECDHGEMPGMPCPPCDRQRGAAAMDDLPGPWSAIFQARFPGTCTGCEFDIQIGQHICGRDTNDGREHRHAGACLEED